VPIPPDRVRDPWERNVPGLGRDPQRTPLPWDSSPNAGFTPAGVQPWLPLGPDAADCNVATQRDDPRSLLSLTRHLLALRRATPALSVGSYRSVDGVPSDCFAYLREADGQRWLVALNFASTERLLHLSAAGHGTIVASTHLDREGPVELATLRLRPAEGAVMALAPE